MKSFIIAGCMAGIGLVLSIQTAGGVILYQVTDLGTVNGAFRSEARGINNRGQIWGENFNTDYPYFFWVNNTNYGIAKPADGASMSLYGLNDAVQFAGSLSYPTTSRNTSFRGLPNDPELLATNFGPHGLNFNAILVGSTTIKVEIYPGSGPIAPVNRPAIVAGPFPTILPSLAGAGAWVNADGLAINDNEVVVGSSGTSSNRTHAFLWDGTMHDLHTLGTRSNSVAVAINNNGTVVGYMYDFLSFREPFIWTPATGMTALSLPGGYATGQPLGLNNRGDIVGVAGSGSAVIWTNGVMTDLQTVIPTSPAWDLDGAYGINDAGEIVGYGYNGGLTKGFLLRLTNVPPVQFKIELLDPVDPAVTNVFTGTGITSDRDTLNQLSVWRVGIAADAASRLLVRVSTTNHGTVALSLRAADGASGVTGDQTEDGGVGNVGGYGGMTLSLTRFEMPTETTAQGIRAYAFYHAPKIFHRAGTNDSGLPQRPIRLQAEFHPDTGPGTTQTVALVIVRPPLIVLHGIWSDSDLAFSGFIKSFRADELGLKLFAPNYPNAVSFASNDTEVKRAIGNARAIFRGRNFACTRADIFAHSMGGVLSRLYAGREDYNRPENYGRGDINRLVTIDSPHRGAIFADAVNGVFNWLDTWGMNGVHRKLADEMTQRGMPPELGAGYDLLTASPAIADMNKRGTDVATHAIVGNFSFEVNLKTLPEPFGGFYSLLDKTSIPGVSISNLFFSPVPNSDLIVSTDSQYAGLAGDTTTTFNHFHVGAANTTNVINRCESLYRKPANHDWYAKGFPTGWVAPPPPPPPLGPAGLLKIFVDAVLLFFAAGPDVHSGAIISASVAEPAGTNFTSVLLLTRDAALTDTNAPFNFSVPIPAEAVGNYPVSYYATDTASNLWTGTQILSVTPLASLNYLEAAPHRFIFTRLGDQEQITATGVYFDIPRNVTDPSTGTTYASADTNVVTIETNGVMTARGSGETRITIANAGKTAFVDVVVTPLPSPDLALIHSASTSKTFAGVPVVFTLRVTNVGPETANSVYLADPLPADAQFQSATASQGTWSFTNGLFAAMLGTLAPTSIATATVTLVFTNSGAHISTATVAAIGLDANSADNVAAALVNVTVLPALTISFDGTNVLLAWPTNATGFELERSSDFNPPITWNPAAANPPTIGDHFEFSIPPTNAPAYFRLRHP